MTGITSFAVAARIAWRQARTFNALATHQSTAAAGVLMAPALWPATLVSVTRNAGAVRHLATASMTLHHEQRRPRPVQLQVAAVAVAVACLIGFLAVGTAVTIAITLATRWRPDVIFWIWMCLIAVPLLVHTGWLTWRLQDREARDLHTWRAQHQQRTGHRTYLLTDFVRARGPKHRGDGERLLTALQQEWTQNTDVVLVAANQAVARFYERYGAERVSPGSRRLILTNRCSAPRTGG